MTKAANNARIADYPVSLVKRRNYVINGNFDVWQRGTVFTDANGMTADRWYIATNGTGGSRMLTRQAHGSFDGYPTYYMKWEQITAETGNTWRILGQHIEGVETLAGKKATLSFWMSSWSGTFTCAVGLVQDFGTGGSPSPDTSIYDQNFTVTTAVQRYSFTFEIPSIYSKTKGTNGDDFLDLKIYFPSGTNTFTALNIWGVQLEEGSETTDFEYRPLSEELDLCYRYYQSILFGATNSPAFITYSGNGDTRGSIPLKRPMRTYPSCQVSPSTWAVIATGSQNMVIGGTLNIQLSTSFSPMSTAVFVSNYSALSGCGSAVTWGTNTPFTITASAEI